MTANEIGSVTQAVAQWSAGLKYSQIPEQVVEYAKVLLLDGIGCSILGVERDAGRALYRFVTRSAVEKAEATVWGKNKRLTVQSAALINATAAHTANVGDTHRATILHTNYITPQAAVAIAEQCRSSGKEVLTAIVAGNEVGTRAGMAAHVGAEGGYFTPEGRGWHATGTFGALAAAVTSGRLLRLSASQMVQAIVIGGTQITGMYRPCGPHMGKHWYAGKAVANGIESAFLAKDGFIAGYRYFEDGLCFGSGTISPVFDCEAASCELGSRWETLNIDMAIYPAKKIYYPNLDALLHIIKTEKLQFPQLARIVVRTAFGTAHDFGIFRKPTSSTDAFNSLRHTIAAAAHDGEFTFGQLERRKFAHPAIVAFSRDQIEVVQDPVLENLRPQKWPGAVDVHTHDGRRFSKSVEYHIGQVENPVTKTDVEKKFYAMTARIGRRHSRRILELVSRLETLSDVLPLARALWRQ